MSLDQLLGELREGGRLDSTGRLGIDPCASRDKLRSFQLREPHEYILMLVQALVRAGADRLHFQVTPWKLLLAWRGGEPLYAVEKGLRFLSPDFGQGLLLAQAQGRRVTLDGLQLGVGLSLGSEAQPSDEHRLVLSRRWPGLSWPELAHVRQRCRYCPAGTWITIGAQRVNPPLEIGLCRSLGVMLGRVPSNQYPLVGQVEKDVGCWTCGSDPFCLIFTTGNWTRSSQDPCLLDRYQSAEGIVVDGVFFPFERGLRKAPNYRLLVIASGLPVDLSRQSVRQLPPGLEDAVDVLHALLLFCRRPVEEASWFDLGAFPHRRMPFAVASPEWQTECGLAIEPSEGFTWSLWL